MTVYKYTEIERQIITVNDVTSPQDDIHHNRQNVSNNGLV